MTNKKISKDKQIRVQSEALQTLRREIEKQSNLLKRIAKTIQQDWYRLDPIDLPDLVKDWARGYSDRLSERDHKLAILEELNRWQRKIIEKVVESRIGIKLNEEEK